jgi:hypothetical protein
LRRRDEAAAMIATAKHPIVLRVDFGAWQTKHEPYSLVGEALDQELSTRDFSHPSLSCSIE